MVQDMAVRILTYWDNQEEQRKETERFKLALMTAGRLSPAEAFPELFPDEHAEIPGSGPVDDSEVDLDYSAVTWESPAEDGGNEYDRVMMTLDRFKTITTRDGDLNAEEVTTEFNAEPDDPEWI
jgi:hypothetical protein